MTDAYCMLPQKAILTFGKESLSMINSLRLLFEENFEGKVKSLKVSLEEKARPHARLILNHQEFQANGLNIVPKQILIKRDLFIVVFVNEGWQDEEIVCKSEPVFFDKEGRSARFRQEQQPTPDMLDPY